MRYFLILLSFGFSQMIEENCTLILKKNNEIINSSTFESKCNKYNNERFGIIAFRVVKSLDLILGIKNNSDIQNTDILLPVCGYSHLDSNYIIVCNRK